MSDYQQVCPHCGKLIEPGYYAYDKPVQTAALDNVLQQAQDKLVERIAKEVREKIGIRNGIHK